MGYLAQSTGQTIDSVVQGGQGLSFIVFPFAGMFFFVYECEIKAKNIYYNYILVTTIPG
jgi:hypothetical protein